MSEIDGLKAELRCAEQLLMILRAELEEKTSRLHGGYTPSEAQKRLQEKRDRRDFSKIDWGEYQEPILELGKEDRVKGWLRLESKSRWRADPQNPDYVVPNPETLTARLNKLEVHPDVIEENRRLRWALGVVSRSTDYWRNCPKCQENAKMALSILEKDGYE